MKEKLQSELAQLLEKQNKARRDEVFEVCRQRNVSNITHEPSGFTY